ncbi:digeranylgeranylglycerophospholipid reductase [Acidilobus sp.]|uniref:digeranylgeranylglycerophospholipid reductase n=1 Tax=Acidilobus sp. TaxID=1872109 RepID=UPI003D088BFF
MTKELTYDVVIVGLGPAGSSLAYFLRKSGLEVAGIEMNGPEGAWGKPCGDAIGKHHFDETGLPYPTGESLKQKIDGIDIVSPYGGVKLRVNGEGFIIDRNKYGLTLINESAKGDVDIYMRTRVTSPKLEGGRLVGVYAKGENGEDLLFKGKIIVDATGNSGLLRRQLPTSWPVNEPLDPKDANIAYREIRELNYTVEEPSYLKIYVNQEISPGGYWWYFPEGKESANIGLGVQGGMGYPTPNTIFKQRLEKLDEVKNYRKVINAAGSKVPTRRPANTLVWDNFIGIGDNGYTVNPVHGGGMGYAMVAAYYASKSIIKAFTENDFSAKALWDLNINYIKSIGRRQASLDIFRIFLQRLSNDDIEYGLKHGVMNADQVYETSVSGELKANLGLLDKVSIALRMLGRPSLLPKLATVAAYMKRVQQLYDAYPTSPEGLDTWVSAINALYSEYKSRIGVA